MEQIAARRQRRRRRPGVDEEGLGPDDEDAAVARQRAGHRGGGEVQHAGPQRVVGREVEVRVQRRAVDAGAERLGQGGHGRHGVAGGHLVADDQRHVVGGGLGQQPGQLVEPPGHRPAVEVGPGRDVDVAGLVEHVHGDRHEHRPGRRRGRRQERPPQHRRQLAQMAHLVLPLRRRRRQAGEVTGEDRFGQQVAPVLLAGRDHHRRTVGQGVGQVPEAAAEAGHGVEVDEAGPPAGLGVPVGHGHGHVLLEAQHVVDLGVLGQSVDEGQLGRARVAEAVDHPLGAKHLEQDIPPVRRRHSVPSSWTEDAPYPGRSGQSQDGPGGAVGSASNPSSCRS